MDKAQIEAVYALSPVQQGMLFHSLYAPGSGVYTEQVSCTVVGDLDLAILEQAWQHVIDRHAILRTAFVWENLERPMQVVQRGIKLPVEYHDWQALEPTEQIERFAAFQQTIRNNGFVLSRAPLMHVALIQIAANAYYFVWTHHHLLMDGWATSVVLREVFTCYAALAQGIIPQLAPTRPFRDYINWLKRQDLAAAEQYWRRTLAGFTAPTPLVVDLPAHSAPQTADDYTQAQITLPEATTERLQALARQSEITLNTLVQGVWALLLSRYSGENDVVFGATVSGRPADLPGVDSMVGLFINTLPVRVKADPQARLIPWLQSLQAQQLELHEYEYSPLAQVQQWSEVQRSVALFESIVVFQNYPIDQSLQGGGGSLEFSAVQANARTNYPLTLIVVPQRELMLNMIYECRRFDQPTIERMLGHLRAILESIAARPDQRLGNISILTAAELQQQAGWNATVRPYPRHLCIHDLFEMQVERTPGAVAAIFEGKKLTYRELNQQSNQVAHLLKKLGVGSGMFVGIDMSRGLEMIPALLGILKAGAAYVPLEPGFPKARAQWILGSLDVSCVLTQSWHLPLMQELRGSLPRLAHVLCLDTDQALDAGEAGSEASMQIWTWTQLKQMPQHNLPPQATPNDFAYIIFTSGSTGNPKGVVERHEPVINLIDWVNRMFAMGPDDQVLFITSLCFDLSVYDVFGLLAAGGSIQIVSEAAIREPEQLLRLLCDEPITYWDSAPAALQQLVPTFPAFAEAARNAKLRLVFLSGDWIPITLPDNVRSIFRQAQVIGLGGATEATVWSNFYPIGTVDPRWVSIPYGRPIQNARYYVLDAHLHPCPIGVPGDLYIAGECLATLYANEPILTASKFMPDPFAPGVPGAVMYKTGDRARFWPDGLIEFLGRVDHQVKIRGFRIELGEIETVLMQHPAVRDSVVLARQDIAGDSSSAGRAEKRLVAYVIPSTEQNLGEGALRAELRDFLREHLPDYMIPAAFVLLDAFPVTSNGKLDRKALPAPDRVRPELETQFVAPRTETESLLAEVWTAVLGLERIGVHDNFFELGGDSILSLQVVSRASKAGLRLTPRHVFQHQTIAELAAQIAAESAAPNADDDTSADVSLALVDQALLDRLIAQDPSIEDLYPLSAMQQGMLFHSLYAPTQGLYCEQLFCTLQGNLHRAQLEHAWQLVIDRHSILRTACLWDGLEQPLQAVRRSVQLPIDWQDWRDRSAAEQQTALAEYLAANEQRGFALDQAPLLRLAMFQTADDRYICVWTFHHLLLDGWSFSVLFKDVLTAYEALTQGFAPEFEQRRPYRDYIAWLQRQDITRAETFWRQSLAGFTAPTPLALDRTIVLPETEPSYAELRAYLRQDTTVRLQAFARQQQLTLNTLVVGAWTLLLARYSRENDVVFGVTVSGRPPELAGSESMIGLFINTLPLRLRVPPTTDLLPWLHELQNHLAEQRQYEFTPLTEIKGWSDLPRDLPLFESIVAFENYPIDQTLARHTGAITIQDVQMQGRTNYPLALVVMPGAELCLQIGFDRRRFRDATAERVLEHMRLALETMAAQPGLRLGQMPLLTPAERQRILVDWNNTATSYRQHPGLLNAIEAHAGRAPESVAVVQSDRQMSYAELNTRANQLAHRLRALGVGPDRRVAICMRRSPELIVGMLGVLKAGGAYIPLDPAYPAERLLFMLNDAQAPVLLTQRDLAPLLADQVSQCSVLLLDDWTELEQQPTFAPAVQAAGDHLAYVIYTSGSTGTPKGVEVAHANLLNLVCWHVEAYNLTPNDRCTHLAGLGFDASVWEIWPALFGGARLYLPDEETRLMPARLRDWLLANRISVGFVPTPLAEQLLALPWPAAGDQTVALRFLLTGGDKLHRYSRPELPFVLVNHYGPTECTVLATAAAVPTIADDESDPTIGRPTANAQVYLLDPQLEPVPVGVAGELYIGGAGVARGYLNRPALTAARFVPDPFSATPGSRLYRTGDLARFRPDGSIEYLGRLDHQVKLRGFRIELGEIESVLRQHEAVRDSVVLLRDDRLVAYVVSEQNKEPGTENRDVGEDCSLFAVLGSPQELRSFLHDRLPEYMIPSAFVLLDALPLTPSGKIDTRALPAPDTAAAPDVSYVAPRTPTEQILADAWSVALGVSQVGIYDNYFALGGDSIRSIQVVAEAQRHGLSLSLQQLFQHQTLHELAQAVLEAPNSAAIVQPVQPFELLNATDRQQLPPDVEDAYPLTRLQVGMLFHGEYSPDTTVYHNISTAYLRAPYDEQALHTAIQALAMRHATLRSSFDLHSFSEPIQLVHRQRALPVQIIDLRTLAEAEQAAALAEWFEAEKRRKFSRDETPLRFTIHRRADDKIQFSITFHHALLDGWSVVAMLAEIFQHYLMLLNGSTQPDLSVPALAFRDFVAAEQRVLASETARDYWLATLENSSVMTIPRWPAAWRPEPEQAIGQEYVQASAEVSARLLQVAQTLGVPVKSVLLAAHLRVLSRLAEQPDVVTGLVANGRPEGPGGERVLGMFLNTLPLRMRMHGGTWADLIRATFAAEREALPFRQYPLVELQKLMGGHPLFETAFNFTHYHVYQGLQHLSEIELLEGHDHQETNFTLLASFSVNAISSQVELRLLYNAAELCAPQVEALGGYYMRALESIALEPYSRYETNSLLTWQELAQRSAWNATDRPYPANICMHELFEAQAARKPNALAVIAEDATLTYAQLNQRANQIARLLRSLGVERGALVGVYLSRSSAMIPALLGILKAGGTYVPLEPSFPAARIQWTLGSLGIRHLLTNSAHLPNLAELQSELPDLDHLVCLDAQSEPAPVDLRPEVWTPAQLDEQPPENLPPLAESSDLAYIIFTSGSTGTPKGVMVRHQQAVNLIDWANRSFALSPKDRVLFITSLCFDLSVYDVFGLLAAGGSIRVASEQEAHDPERLLRILQTEPITFWDSAPAALQQLAPFLATAAERGPGALRLVFLSGDWIPVSLPDQVRGVFTRAEVIALGGATEATIWSNFFPIGAVDPRWVSIPYGRPIENARYYVLDEQLNHCPIGVPGDLYIGGDCLAVGYIQSPALTAQKFIPDPFADDPHALWKPIAGSVMYRTGDRARFWPNGLIEFLGRVDFQVKIRGFRIELGEIEATLRQHPAIQEAVVVAHADQSAGAPGSKRLVAYFSASGEAAPTVGELRSFIQERLPEYMTPAVFVQLAAWPVTSNGKLDRQKLPHPDETRMALTSEFAAPRTPMEELLSSIWSAVLRVEQIGVYDNFFELGGDSISTIQIVARAHQAGVALNAQLLFEHPTIAALAVVAQQTTAESAEQGVIVGPVPLTPWQQRFFAQHADPDHVARALLLDVAGPLDPALLDATIQQLLAHHDALRLRFEQTESGWQQINAEIEEQSLVTWLDLRSAPAAEDALIQATTELRDRLDLKSGPLLQVAILHRDHQPDQVLLVLHELIADDPSWAILLADIQAIFAQLQQGATPFLPLKSTSFKAWAEQIAGLAENERQDHAAYLQALTSRDLPELPTDYAGENTIASERSVVVALGEDETAALLREALTPYQAQVEDLLLSALAQAFESWTYESALMLDLERDGRMAAGAGINLARTVGPCATRYPAVLEVEDGFEPGVALKRIKEQLRQIPRDLLVANELAPAVSFRYLPPLDESLPEQGLITAARRVHVPLSSQDEQRSHTIAIEAAVVAGRLELTWRYSEQIHDRSTIEMLAQSYLESLQALIVHCLSPEAGGFTPSDFPEAELSQDELDSFFAKIAQSSEELST